MIEGCQAWKFLGFNTLSDGSSVTVMHNGRDIGVKRDDFVMQVGILPSEARCITFEGDDVVISTDSGPCRLYRTVDASTHEDSWNCLMPSGQYPGLHFCMVDRGEVALSTGGITFAKPYDSWGNSLASADIRAISSSLKDAYSRLTRSIAEAGDFTQPVAVRYKLRDSRGKLLFTGPVNIIAPQGGWQGMDAMTARVHSDSTGRYVNASAVTLSLRRFTLAVDLPGRLSNCDAPTDGVYAEVYVLPQLHPLDASTNAEYRLSSTPGEESITLWLPGATLGRAPLTSRLTRSLASAPSFMPGHEVKIATIKHPFALKTRRIELPIPDSCVSLHREAAEDNASWRQMTYTTADESELAGLRLAQPHSFSAGCVCRSGKNVVWGRIRRKPFSGYDLNSLTVGDSDQPVKRASIRVTLDVPGAAPMQVVHDMSSSDCEGLIIASDKLSPMVMYPDPAATLMEVRIERQDGSVAETSINLTPSADRRCAQSLSASMQPLSLAVSTAAFVPYTADSPIHDMPSAVGIADSSDTTAIKAATDCCQGFISQIVPAWRANASWDYGAGRFYVMSSSGIYGLAADLTAPSRMKSSLIDPRATVLSHAAVMTPHGVAALAGDDLIMLGGTDARTLLHHVTATSIGYSSLYDELWLPDTYGVTIYPLRNGKGVYRRPDINIRSMTQAGTELVMIDDKGVMRVSSTEDTLAEVSIRWSGTLSHDVRSPAWLTLDMEGDDMQLKASLLSRAQEISSLKIKGSLHHLTGLRITGPLRSRHSLNIEGRVRGNFIIRPATLRLNGHNPVSGFL